MARHRHVSSYQAIENMNDLKRGAGTVFATLYGELSETKPEGRHFVRSSDGIWHLQEANLPTSDIMDAFERLNMKSLQLLFDTPEQFWDTLEASDFNIVHAGLDPEALCNRDDFNRAALAMKCPNTKKLLYYYSIRHHNHVAQNIISHITVSLGDAYAALALPNLHENVPLDEQAFAPGEAYRSTVSPLGFRIWANLNFCIEKTISFLDFSAKYVADLSSIRPGMTSWKSKARDVTFGKWKHTRLGKETPLSEFSDELRLLMSLRDETVHNGTIDHFSRIYEHTSGAKVNRRFVLMPDHDKGRLLTAAGRKRFFSQDNHLNAMLPDMLDRVLGDALASLNLIDERIEKRWDDMEGYFKRYPDLFSALKIAEEENAFLKFTPSDEK